MRALTRSSIKSPAAVTAGVAITVLLGLFAFHALPVQLLPDIERPQIGIETDWRAQTPREVESQIVEPEEGMLQGIAGLQEMEGHAYFGGAYITLSFALGTDMNAALADVVGRLNRVPSLPADAQKPLAQLADTHDAGGALLSVFLQRIPGNNTGISTYERFIRETVAPRLQAVTGVGSVQYTGADSTDELQIVFDPVRAAELNIQIPKIASQIGESDDISGGSIDVGRRKFGISFRGRYPVARLQDTILDWRSGNPVRLGDIATVGVGEAKRSGFAYHNGQAALQIDVFRGARANALDTVSRLKAALTDLNQNAAKAKGVRLEYASDPTPFVEDSIALVAFDIFLGVLLALGVLWFFTRDWHGTLIVSSAIPICFCAVMILLRIAGRSLNVVSLAGLALSCGIVLDAAIVVLENILRLRECGHATENCAHDGTHEVSRALLASTVTNIAVFLPVVLLKDVEGQLFADLALAIAFSVLASFIVAVTVVPVAANVFLRTQTRTHELSAFWKDVAQRVMALTASPRERLCWIAALIGAPVMVAVLLFPPVHYLPDVKRDAIDVSLQYPLGATVDFADRQIAQPIVKRLNPYLTGASDPQISGWFLKMNTPGSMQIAIRMADDSDIPRMIDVLRGRILSDLPDSVAFAQQQNLFGGLNGGIAINIQSPDEDTMRAAARKGFTLLSAAFPGASISAEPTLDYDEPQLELQPNDRAIAESGWTRGDVENLVQALGEGLYVGQRYENGEQLYLILKSRSLNSPEALQAAPLATPNGNVISFGHLVNFESNLAPSGIYTLDGSPTYALNLDVPRNVALSSALSTIRDDIEPRIKAVAGAGGSVRLGAAADHLHDAVWSIGGNFLLAVGILFLIMAAIFRSLRDAAIVTVVLPLGMAGGVMALRILEFFVFQPLDLLTMIGFIVVVGLGVNNTILLVARTRQAMGEGMSRNDAVRAALEGRLRPIFASTLTAVAGMLPLMLIPGAGAEIYRGLGAVVLGGVVVSNTLMILLAPALLRMGEANMNESAPDVLPGGVAEKTMEMG